MIIEEAFLKLPEILLSHSAPHEQYENTIVNYFAMGILTELFARNVPSPIGYVTLEKPYVERFKRIANMRADIYVDLSGVKSNGLGHELYGIKPENWIEVKYFGGIGRSKGSETLVSNVGKISFDLFRLCLFVQEIPTPERNINARYLLCVFNEEPQKYLAFRRKNRTWRDWLVQILKTGEHSINIRVDNEAKSFKDGFSKNFANNIMAKQISPISLGLRTITHSFYPLRTQIKPLYWGYLIRIIDFDISINKCTLSYRDDMGRLSNEFKESKIKLEKEFQGLLGEFHEEKG